MATIQHLLTPVTRSHPWRGGDEEQLARSNYFSRGDGTGIWVPQGAGQFFFKGSHTMVAPATFTLFNPAAAVTAEGIADFVTEDDHFLTWVGDASAYLQIAWSVTLSHTNAAIQTIQAVAGPLPAPTGYERIVQSQELLQNIDTTFSGKTVKNLADGTSFGIFLKVSAGDLVVTQARLSMIRVF